MTCEVLGGRAQQTPGVLSGHRSGLGGEGMGNGTEKTEAKVARAVTTGALGTDRHVDLKLREAAAPVPALPTAASQETEP